MSSVLRTPGTQEGLAGDEQPAGEAAETGEDGFRSGGFRCSACGCPRKLLKSTMS